MRTISDMVAVLRAKLSDVELIALAELIDNDAEDELLDGINAEVMKFAPEVFGQTVITLNGKERAISAATLSYGDIVKMVFGRPTTVQHTITWSQHRGPAVFAGSVKPGESVKVRPGLVIKCDRTT